MANITLHEKQVREALKRMKTLKISDNVIEDFKNNGTLYYSERLSAIFDGMLYWVSNEKRFVDLVKDFENRTGALVYHCQLTHTCIGDMFAMLYVSKERNEWSMDNRDLAQGIAIANVINLDDPSLSDIGSIGVAPKNGGITRTA